MEVDQLRSERLCVDIAVPGTVYTRSRFDWTGNVTQVTLDGAHTFLGSDYRVGGVACGGIGLMNEFFPSDQGTYERAKAGESFLKMGVGILQKLTDEPYAQLVEYPIQKPVKTIQQVENNVCVSTMIQDDFDGYAYLCEKKISVHSNLLQIHYSLCNTGEKTLTFSEYNHNFFQFGNQGKSEDCLIHLPVEPQLNNNTAFSVSEKTIEVCPLETPAVYSIIKGMEDVVPTWMVTEDRNTHHKIIQNLSHHFSKCAVWGLERVISPELFTAHTVLAGEKVEWQRIYLFE